MMMWLYSHIDLADVLVWLTIPLAAIGLTLFASHSVYAILGLIATFIWAALCVSAVTHFEFISLLFIIIYVGAIAVLFIFIVMMIPSTQLRQRANWPVVAGATVLGAVASWIEAGALFGPSATQSRVSVLPLNDISVFSALYSTWALPLVLVAFVLMTTLFGAIILTGQTSLEGDRVATASETK
jgi:NADH-quinone oxidoreductase subunit J